MPITELFRETMELVVLCVETAGVLIILVGSMLATIRFLTVWRIKYLPAYNVYRQDLGRAILLGLEVLIAADIIRTVVVDPTLGNVLVLGLIVIIRTFLSIMLELELDGRWPWQPPARSLETVQQLGPPEGEATHGPE